MRLGQGAGCHTSGLCSEHQYCYDWTSWWPHSLNACHELAEMGRHRGERERERRGREEGVRERRERGGCEREEEGVCERERGGREKGVTGGREWERSLVRT